MFSEPDLATMQLVRCAFDPENIANPDKIFPRPRLCAEKPKQIGARHVRYWDAWQQKQQSRRETADEAVAASA